MCRLAGRLLGRSGGRGGLELTIAAIHSGSGISVNIIHSLIWLSKTFAGEVLKPMRSCGEAEATRRRRRRSPEPPVPPLRQSRDHSCSELPGGRSSS